MQDLGGGRVELDEGTFYSCIFSLFFKNLSSHNASIHLVDLDYHHERSGSALMSSMKIEDDVAGLQLKDLSVLVDDPEKHVGGYVSYNVSTKVTLAGIL